MLTPDQIDALRGAAAQIADPITEYLLKDITRRIAEAGRLTSTAQYQIWRAQQMGVSQRQLKKELRRRLKLSHGEIRRILYQSAQSGYDLDIRRFPYVQAVPFKENQALQQIVSAAVELAQDDFTNIVQTIGFVNPYGKPEPLTGAYISSCDFAFKQVITGAASYTEAIRQATRNLAAKGVRVIDYESGVHTSLEAAVRRNIMGGLGLMQEKISQATHDELGCDGWEITAHANSAPDHEPIQGRQYPDAEYQALNDSLRRRIGTLNCGHASFPIILGVNRPQYTPEELEKFRRDNETGVTVDGVHYTGYQATQMQRALERAIRRQKQRVTMDEAAGDTERLAQDKTKLAILHQRYEEFSKAANLRTQYERTEAAGFGEKPSKKLATSTNSGIIEPNRAEGIPEVGKAATPVPLRAENVTEEYLRTATPGQGAVTYEDGYRVKGHQSEIKMAEWLHRTFGGDIRLLNESTVEGEKRADYLWREHLWDLKDASSEKAANTAIKRGLSQIKPNPGGIILNYGEQEIAQDVLLDVIDKRMQWLKDGTSVDIMIALKDGDVKVLRYNRKG